MQLGTDARASLPRRAPAQPQARLSSHLVSRLALPSLVGRSTLTLRTNLPARFRLRLRTAMSSQLFDCASAFWRRRAGGFSLTTDSMRQKAANEHVNFERPLPAEPSRCGTGKCPCPQGKEERESCHSRHRHWAGFASRAPNGPLPERAIVSGCTLYIELPQRTTQARDPRPGNRKHDMFRCSVRLGSSATL